MSPASATVAGKAARFQRAKTASAPRATKMVTPKEAKPRNRGADRKLPPVNERKVFQTGHEQVRDSPTLIMSTAKIAIGRWARERMGASKPASASSEATGGSAA